MSISITSRALSLLATFTLATTGLCACSIPGLSQANSCSELKDATDSLATALNDVVNGKDATASFETALEDMEAANKDLPNGEVKDTWEELISTVEDVIPLYEESQKLVNDPEALLENRDQINSHTSDMQEKMEALMLAQSDLVKVCPELGSGVGGGDSGTVEPGDSSDSEGRRE